jgi:hypothetical protein
MMDLYDDIEVSLNEEVRFDEPTREVARAMFGDIEKALVDLCGSVERPEDGSGFILSARRGLPAGDKDEWKDKLRVFLDFVREWSYEGPVPGSARPEKEQECT